MDSGRGEHICPHGRYGGVNFLISTGRAQCAAAHLRNRPTLNQGALPNNRLRILKMRNYSPRFGLIWRSCTAMARSHTSTWTATLQGSVTRFMFRREGTTMIEASSLECIPRACEVLNNMMRTIQRLGTVQSDCMGEYSKVPSYETEIYP